VLFFEHKFSTAASRARFRRDYTVPIERRWWRREGKHLTILSYAAMMHTSLEAAGSPGGKKASKRK